MSSLFRAGDLVLAPNASRNAINYSTSVQNRLISYEGPEKVDEPIMEPLPGYNPQRLNYTPERRERPSTIPSNAGQKVLSLNRSVSLIKKPPPNLQRLSLPSTSSASGASTSSSCNVHQSKRKVETAPSYSSGKVFKMSEPEYKKLQSLKKQKSLLADRQARTSGGNRAYPFNQFQKDLRMQQEMLSRQTRSEFEPICDTSVLANENSPTQNLLHNLNLPKSIQVTTAKPPVPLSIPIMPKIPKSLTVIPQTMSKPIDK